MNLCNENHDEVCYEGRKCPVCEVVEDKDQTIEELKAKVSNLEDELANA